MPLNPGTKLGPYEIQSPLGAGGMGEVYRARDTRLERTVAIKILPKEMSADPGRKQRFEREAKTISSLNHPHICTLHDIGSQDGVDYLVMECVEGETLAKRLEKGPLPLEQVLKYGAQVADALDKAHCAGIVHRDLKPGNIMLTAAVPTTPVTQEGTIVGTFQYMSPEQVEGKELDGRSDIFSLGAVLYEMLTGKKAFEGKSQLSVASAILEKEPEAISTLQPMTPPALDHAIRRCLAKDREERWQTARDLGLEVKWVAESGAQVRNAPTATMRRAFGPRAVILSVVALLLVAAIASLATWNLKPSPPRAVTRTMITLPPGQRLAGLDHHALALSPDGSQLAYIAIQGGTQQIYLRAMDSLEARPVPGSEGAANPFFSPDSQWLGFFAGQKLKKISISGGAAETLGDATLAHGASWSDHGTIAFSPATASFLQQVSEAGGAQQPLTRLAVGEVSHRWPEFLPGGKALLFAASTSSFSWTNSQVIVQALGTGERRNLIQGATHPRYASSGHLVYAQGGNLMALPFDARRLAVTGAAVPVVENVAHSPTAGAAQYSISATGTLVYVPGGVQADQRRLVWVARNGAEQPAAAPARAYMFPRISPDGRRVAVGITEQETQLWLYDLAREALTRFTFEGNVSLNAAWTSDGKWIAFQSSKEGQAPNIYWQRSDGSGGLERLTTSEYPNVPMSWSPDGQLLAFMEVNPSTQRDIWILRMGDRKAEPFLKTRFDESVPRFSPDGHWLAYTSNESGRYEIYVQPYPGPGGKWQISTEGGTEPAWNHNGRELFYRNGDKMMAVDIAIQPSFAAGKPRMLFQGPYERTAATAPNYDVSPDGQRFLMLKPADTGESAPTQINVVLNWFEELKRRVPPGNK
ncbi:MAG TPA: protein kinase [Candidatus Angelobacter sp.]|nr:protein kinase [Candidatus Angelobacter sp.]